MPKKKVIDSHQKHNQKSHGSRKSNKKAYNVIPTPQGAAIIDPKTKKQMTNLKSVKLGSGKLTQGKIIIVDKKTKKQVGIGTIKR